MEEEHTKGDGLYESNQLAPVDCDRVSKILQKLVLDNRLSSIDGEHFSKIKLLDNGTFKLHGIVETIRKE